MHLGLMGRDKFDGEGGRKTKRMFFKTEIGYPVSGRRMGAGN